MAGTQTPRSGVDPKTGEIPQRRLADQLRKSGCECGPRQRYITRERSDRPRLGWIGMKQRQSSADLLISNRRQPSEFGGICICFEVPPHSLNKQDVGQSRDYLSCSGAAAVEF
jgi:hypothetical protein